MGKSRASARMAKEDNEVFMRLKLRKQNCAHAMQTMLSCLFLLLSVMGLVLVCTGIAEIPKCRYGGNDCYFFVKICGKKFFETTTVGSGEVAAGESRLCSWVTRIQRVENSSDEGVEQFWLVFVSAFMCIIPPFCLTFSTLIGNKRTILAMAEAGKIFTIFGTMLLVMGMLDIDRLTFDCRWYADYLQPNRQYCRNGFHQSVAGLCLLFVSNGFVLFGLLSFVENQRKKFRNHAESTDQFGNSLYVR